MVDLYRADYVYLAGPHLRIDLTWKVYGKNLDLLETPKSVNEAELDETSEPSQNEATEEADLG